MVLAEKRAAMNRAVILWSFRAVCQSEFRRILTEARKVRRRAMSRANPAMLRAGSKPLRRQVNSGAGGLFLRCLHGQHVAVIFSLPLAAAAIGARPPAYPMRAQIAAIPPAAPKHSVGRVQRQSVVVAPRVDV